MRTSFVRALVSCCFLATLFACPPPVVECLDGTEDVCDAGGLPPDFCNSKEEALADAVNCHVAVASGGATPVPKDNVYLSRLADGGTDQDWYYSEAPGGLTARSLLHITGGYSAAQTAVNFSVNVLKQAPDGTLVSVTTAIDKHGAAAPRPIDVILPFSDSNAKLYTLIADEGVSGQVHVDNRNTYSFSMEVLENPDVNEPNDATPTAIPLSGAPAAGTGTGYLATNDDIDVYSFDVTGSGRQIIYLHITEPTPHTTATAPPYRLSYTLFDPSDRPISEGVVANEFLPIDLATARLAPMTGTYKVKVMGFRPPNMVGAIKGDLDIKYQVEVRLLPDIDAQEGANGNDSAATAKVVSMSGNGRTSLVGKLSYVADEEWFSISLPARSSPSTFRYKVTAAMGGGRFDPLSMTPTREVRVFQRVTSGATAQDRQLACRTSRTACPRAADADAMLLDTICNASDPPLCLWSQRTEELPRITNIRNLVGALPVTQNQATEFVLVFKDEGLGATKYADDRDWTLELEYLDDADEASRVAGPTMLTLGGTAQVLAGELSYGYGKWLDDQYFNSSDGLRARADYDAFDTDKDLFQVSYGGAMGDQGWEVSWELAHPDGGTEPPGELALELTFCGTGAAPDGGLCAGSAQRIFAYNDNSLTPWYLPQSASNGRMLFSKTSTATSTTITALPVGCPCFSAARTAGGSYFINAAALHRTANDPLRYRITQRMLTYPGTFTGADGGTASCPAVDGGCGFAR